MKVQIAFDLSANGVGNWFTLDDATKGVLDGATYVLAGDVLTDVTSDVRSVQIRRGRSRQLSKFTAGNANVTLDNRARKYDPLYASSPYYGSIVPRKQVVIERDGYVLGTFLSEDWNFSYDLSADNTAEVSCVDGLAQLAAYGLPAGTSTSQATGTRVGAVLDTIGWPTPQRAISTGQATLGADVVAEGDNALTYLQKVEASEPGALFVNRAGAVTFKDRNDLQSFTSGVTFADDGTGIGFQDIEVTYGTEELTNSVTVTYTGGTATSVDATSVAAYGTLDATIDSLLSGATDAQSLADWTVNKYAQPTYRITGLVVNLDGVSTASQVQLLGLDLGDVVYVTWTPNATGSAIAQYCTVEGIEHNATPAAHLVKLTLAKTSASFLLDSSTFGVLDTNALGW